MQDNFIFSDTILNNIVLKKFEKVDLERLKRSAEIANILSWVESLTLGFETKIGVEGIGVSQGQKQRLLIARTVYKNPNFIFFDEATNSLDSENENIIISNLTKNNKEKTVIVIAHRLSTIKNADKIIVLKNGSIEEVGSHEALINKNGFYNHLIEKQL